MMLSPVTGGKTFHKHACITINKDYGPYSEDRCKRKCSALERQKKGAHLCSNILTHGTACRSTRFLFQSTLTTAFICLFQAMRRKWRRSAGAAACATSLEPARQAASVKRQAETATPFLLFIWGLFVTYLRLCGPPMLTAGAPRASSRDSQAVFRLNYANGPSCRGPAAAVTNSC